MKKVKSTWGMYSEIENLNCHCSGMFSLKSFEIINILPFSERATLRCELCGMLSTYEFEIESCLETDMQFFEELTSRWPADAGRPYPMAENKLPNIQRSELNTYAINGRWQIYGARKGSMASVYLCFDKFDPQNIVICKRPNMGEDHEAQFNECIMSIMLTWRSGLNSEHLLKLLDIDSNFPGTPNIIYEAVLPDSQGRSTLEEWIKSGQITEDLAFAWVDHIATGLIHCRTLVPGFVHADLKPDNILISIGYICKISDFGLSGTADDIGVPGAPLYRAPELWSGNITPTIESDIYSLGCIAYEMFTGIHPFRHCKDLDSLYISHRDKNPEKNNLVPDIIIQCLSKDPDERPTLKQLTEHFHHSTTRRELQIQGDECANNGAAALIALGRPDIAIEILNRLECTNESILINRAIAFSQLGLHDKANDIYERPEFIENADVIHLRAANYLRQGDSVHAVLIMEELIKNESVSLAALITASSAYNNMGRHDEALEIVKRAKKVDPGNNSVMYQLGYTLLKLKRYSAAKTEIERFESIAGRTMYTEELRALGKEVCPRIFTL